MVPLAAAAPVTVKAAIQAIKGSFCIEDQSMSARAPSNLSRNDKINFKVCNKKPPCLPLPKTI